MEGVVSVIPNRILKLHTTRSWDFMDFYQNQTKVGAGQEGNVIVGLLDTGNHIHNKCRLLTLIRY